MTESLAYSQVGGWRETYPPAWRHFAAIGPLPLESGAMLADVVIAYETFGKPRHVEGRIVNAVLVEHALTGDAHVAGPAGPGQVTAGWWDELVGPGRPLDTNEWFVLASNVLGGCQGTTGPSSLAPDGTRLGSRFPPITIRDQVEAEARLAEVVGVDRWAAVIGGSMGGMRALEWTVGRPDQVGAALVLACGGAATADQIGTQTVQLHAIRADPGWAGGDYYDSDLGPANGLGIARRVAHLTYRAEHELDVRFGRREATLHSHFAVQSYLDHHANKLVRRFDAGSYVVLTEAMNSHDVGRDRGGVAAALGSVRRPVVVGGVDSDRLYPLRLQAELAEQIESCAGLDVISSPYGHDAFLIETDAVGDLVRRTLELSQPAPQLSPRLVSPSSPSDH